MRGFRQRTAVGAALALLEARTGALASETVAVTAAAGRVSAGALRAQISVPHFDRCMMDGYAVVAESSFGASETRPRVLRLMGEIRAGHDSPLNRPLQRGEALAVTTGAPLPLGADAVLMAELTRQQDSGSVLACGSVSPGRHVAPLGEDITEGSIVVAAGRYLRPQDAGVLASVGVAELEVVRRPRARMLITGDELLVPGSMPSGPHIVDSNSVVLQALLQRDGAHIEEPIRCPDDAEALREALCAPGADIVLVSGGSSVGPEDHAPQVLAALGELAVHGVAMRPSSPTGFGFIQTGDGHCVVLLLPGNPVSCLCAYEFFGGPTVRALGGRSRRWPHHRLKTRTGAKIVSQLGRTDYVRVTLDEQRRACPLLTSGASILSSTTRAAGVVIVPEAEEGLAENQPVEVLLYDPFHEASIEKASTQ